MTEEECENTVQAVADCESMQELVGSLSALRDRRSAFRREDGYMKRIEEALRQRLVQHLDVQGMKTINFDGLGRVTRTVKQRAEIIDFDAVARFVSESMKSANAEDRPPVDGLSLLKRGVVIKQVQALEAAGVSLGSIGVRLVDNVDISFSSSK